jgi:hypothetical protein
MTRVTNVDYPNDSSSLRGLPEDLQLMLVDGKPKQTKNGSNDLMLSKEQKDEECDATEA